jgi:hypothetical protein
MEKVLSKLERINNLIDTNKYHLYRNNKIILSETTLKKVKDELKTFENPTKYIKVFLVSINIDPKYKYPIIINCSQNTITPKLALLTKEEDMSISVTYNKEELLKVGFKLSHIKKIIYALKNDLIDFTDLTESITDILNVVQSKK